MTMLSSRNRSKTTRNAAVNGNCCLADCANPFDLAIIPVNILLDGTLTSTVEVNLRTEAYTGQIVGIRVLNQPGNFDIVQMSSPASRAGAVYIGSGSNKVSLGGNTDEGDFVDAAIYRTDQCMCAIDLGCANTNTGPKIELRRSVDAVADKAGADTRDHLVTGANADVHTRMNFYICYDAAQLADPSRLCPV